MATQDVFRTQAKGRLEWPFVIMVSIGIIHLEIAWPSF